MSTLRFRKTLLPLLALAASAVAAPTASTVKAAKAPPPAPQATASAKPSNPQPSGFILYKGAPDKLGLYFRTPDPNWELNRKASVVVQILPPAPLQVSPDILFASNLPAGDAPLAIAVKGAQEGTKYRIVGKASYTLCHKSRRDCKVQESLLDVEF